MKNTSPRPLAPPPHPGEILKDCVMPRFGITQETLAVAMGVSRFTVNEICNERRSVTPDTALRLSRVLSTTPDFWLNLQRGLDLFNARDRIDGELAGLTVLRDLPPPPPKWVPGTPFPGA